MLRAVLGICGVSLIAFGIFGGQALENIHRSISGFFTPDTVVVEASSPSGDVVSQPVVTAAEPVAEIKPAEAPKSEDGMIVLASADQSSTALLKPVDNADEQVIEVQAASEDVTEPAVVPALLKNEGDSSVALETLATASKSVEKTPELPVADDLKAEGVEIVLSSTTGIPPNDTLFVLKERVNMREGPSTEHPIVLQLEIGQELMEFKRDGRWVHVGAYGTSGKIGWVHNTLVGTQ